MFVLNFSRYPLPLKLMSFVLNVSKSCMLCPLGQTQFFFFFVKTGHLRVFFFVFLPIYLILLLKNTIIIITIIYILVRNPRDAAGRQIATRLVY
ncbi:hypothetical protein Hanom_Chr06g00559801 [Helianthus anomalus]